MEELWSKFTGDDNPIKTKYKGEIKKGKNEDILASKMIASTNFCDLGVKALWTIWSLCNFIISIIPMTGGQITCKSEIKNTRLSKKPIKRSKSKKLRLTEKSF